MKTSPDLLYADASIALKLRNSGVNNIENTCTKYL